jgi:hypothetical protein
MAFPSNREVSNRPNPDDLADDDVKQIDDPIRDKIYRVTEKIKSVLLDHDRILYGTSGVALEIPFSYGYSVNTLQSTTSIGNPGRLFHTYTTPSLPAGTYELRHYSEQTNAGTSQLSYRKITLDGSQILYVQGSSNNIDDMNPWTPFTQFTISNGGSVHKIELSFGKVSGSDKTSMLSSRFTLRRVG